MISSIRRGNSFVTAYISGPFQAHIAKSRKENPFHLGTLRCLNSRMPIRVGSTQPPMLAAPPSIEVAMIDVPMLPTTDENNQVVHTTTVLANQMTIAQQKIAQAAWHAIQLARQDTRITQSELHNLEERFDSLVGELNKAYTGITDDTEGGMKFLYEDLHGISIQASQFSGLVHQQITKTAEGNVKIVALQVANQSNNDNLEILAQIVQPEKNHRPQRDRALDHRVRGKNQDISELKGDTILTKEQVHKVQMELNWERARNNCIAQDQAAALARVEEKIAKAIQSTQNLEELKAKVIQNFQEARAESVSTTAEIRKGIRNLSTRCPPRPTAEDYFKESAERTALRRETGLDLDALLETHETFLKSGNGGRGPPKGLTALAGNPNDSDPSSEPTTPMRRPSPLPRRKRLSSEKQEDKSMTALIKILDRKSVV